MATQTGTATDFHDLLDQLRVFVSANGWTTLEHTPAPAGLASDPVRQAAVQTLTVRGPGTGVGREVYTSFRTVSDLANQHFSWELFGHTDYDNTLSVENQPGAGPIPLFGSTAGSMTYWFYVNDRRIIVVSRIGTNYISMYAGFLLANALPTEYPHPLYISGNYLENRIPQFANARNRFIADPGTGAAFYRSREGTWERVENHTQNTSNDTGYQNGYKAIVWPLGAVTTNSSNNNNSDWVFGGLRVLRPNGNGEIVVFPATVQDCRLNIDRQVGVLDGVFVVPGFQRTVEELLTVAGRDMRVFTNIFRSSFRDFMAIEDT